EITNVATSNPIYYYVVSFLFMLLTIWVFGFMTMLNEDEQEGMNVRFTMLGVTIWQQTIAKILITLVGVLTFVIVLFLAIQRVISFELYAIDYIRIVLFVILYSIQLIALFVLCQIWIRSNKMSLLAQVVLIEIGRASCRESCYILFIGRE